MDLVALANSPAASFIAAFSPTAKKALDFVHAHPKILERGLPVILAAAKEGPAVIEDVRRDAPELLDALRGLLETSASPSAPARAALTSDLSMENVLRNVAGLPKLDFAQEKAWMDRMNPISDDSRSGSG